LAKIVGIGENLLESVLFMNTQVKDQFAMFAEYPTLTDEELQEVSGGNWKQAGTLTGSMLAGVGAGAAAGSAIFPGIGTGAGAIFGGMFGTIGWAVAYLM
jgi:bacteriocin-like protein